MKNIIQDKFRPANTIYVTQSIIRDYRDDKEAERHIYKIMKAQLGEAIVEYLEGHKGAQIILLEGPEIVPNYAEFYDKVMWKAHVQTMVDHDDILLDKIRQSMHIAAAFPNQTHNVLIW